MNKKLFYAALALPMMFAACSQEELFVEGNGGTNAPGVQGVKVNLVTTKGDVDETTRTTWDGSAFSWKEGDKVSVYWLADQSSDFEGRFNSVFKTDDGVDFSSESLIYQGGNVAVYPTNLSHTKIQKIEISIPASQGADVITTTPYISNKLNVDANTWHKNQQAGYDKPLYAPMKQAANVVVFDFELKNTADLLANEEFGFEVQSVSLVANKDAFATTASIVKSDREEYNNDGSLKQTVLNAKEQNKEELKGDWGQVISTHYAITDVLAVSATASTEQLTATNVEVVDAEKGLYRATFVVLPTDAKTFDAASEIVIETSCGRINMRTQEYNAADGTWTDVASLTSKPQDAADNWTAPANTGTVINNSKETLTIAQMVEKIASYGRSSNSNGNFYGEKIGKLFKMSFVADMANATLNNSKVYDSDDIRRYVGIYTAMKSTENMNLVLETRGIQSWEEKTFKLDKNAMDLVNDCNTYANNNTAKNPVTLSLGNADGVMLTGGGDVYLNHATTGNSGNAVGMWEQGSLFTLELDNSAAWNMNDSWSHANVAKIVVNGGATLNIAGTLTNGTWGSQSVLASAITNKGTINIAGNDILKENGMLTNNGTVNVAADQDLRFNVSTSIAGTVNVAADAFLTVEEGIILTSTAIINNSGVVSSIAGAGGITNNGTINVKDDNAITYVQENNHVINLKNRNDEVKVQGAKGDIVYNYTAEDGEVFVRSVSDKFTKVVFGDATGTLVLTGRNLGDIDMTFNGTTELYTNGEEIRDLVVGIKGHLKLLTPDENYSKVLNVRNLTNNKNITIGGTIYYTNSFTGNGQVRSVGAGAIIYSEVTVGSVAELQAALAEGRSPIALTEAIEFTEDVTLDLNGCTITSEGDALEVTAGTLTITGNGTVKAGSGDAYVAVWANGGNVVIENGTFSVGTDANGKCNDCIYAKGGTITINGGTYSHAGTDSSDGGAVVNAHNTIPNSYVIVNGGTFSGHQVKETGDVADGRVEWNI